MERVWTFKSGRFLVTLDVEEESYPRYDGDDEGGETQAALDRGEYVMFDSRVTVYLNGAPIGRDYLGGSVYAADGMAEFWTAHRTSAPEYRNTLAQKAAGRCIGHYFPDMVREAIREARTWLEASRIAA